MQHLAYRGFTGRCRYNHELGFYVGRLEGVAGIVSFRGDSPREAQEQFIAAVDSYLATAPGGGRARSRELAGPVVVSNSPRTAGIRRALVHSGLQPILARQGGRR